MLFNLIISNISYGMLELINYKHIFYSEDKKIKYKHVILFEVFDV